MIRVLLFALLLFAGCGKTTPAKATLPPGVIMLQVERDPGQCYRQLRLLSPDGKPVWMLTRTPCP